MCYPRTGNQETEKRVSGQRSQFGCLKETGNKWGASKKDQVHAKSGQETEPEDGIVILMSDFFPVGQRRDESAFLQSGSYQ